MSGCLVVDNLHPDVSKGLLYDRFITFGTICSVQVVRRTSPCRSFGTGCVKFRNVAEAEFAMGNLMFRPLLGIPMRITCFQRDPTVHHSEVGNLFIKGLAKDVESNALRDHFSVFGEVLHCKIASDRLGSKGYGFVQFKTMEAAINAIRNLDGMLLNGKKISIARYKTFTELEDEQARKREQKSLPPSLFVSNLPNCFTSKQLGRLFHPFGTVLRATVMMENGRSKEFGVVSLKDHEDTANALATMNGRWVGTKKLFVALCHDVEKIMKPTYTLPPGSFGSMHNKPSLIPPATLQDVKGMLLKGEKFQRLLSAIQLEHCEADINRLVQRPAYTLVFGSMHNSAPNNLPSLLQPSTLQAIMPLLLQGGKSQQVVSSNQQELCKTVIDPMPVQPFSHPALNPGNFVETLDAIRLAVEKMTPVCTSQLLGFQSSTPQNAACFQKNSIYLNILADLLDNFSSLIRQTAVHSSNRTDQVAVVQEQVNLPAMSSRPAQGEYATPQHAPLMPVRQVTQPAISTSKPKYCKALQNMADLYTAKNSIKTSAKKSKPLLETMKSGLTSVVSSPLTWTLIGVYDVIRL